MELGAEISPDQVLLQGDLFFFLGAFSSSFLKFWAKMLPFGVNCRLQFGGLGRKNEEGVKSTCFMSESNQSQYSSTVEALNLIVESTSLPAEVNDLNIELHLLVEVKEKLAIILFRGF